VFSNVDKAGAEVKIVTQREKIPTPFKNHKIKLTQLTPKNVSKQFKRNKTLLNNNYLATKVTKYN